MKIMEQLIKEGLRSEHLDDVVHDAASQMASNANTGGMKEQIEFLVTLAGWSEEEILEAVREKRSSDD